MTASLAPTARGLRLIRATKSLAITVPPPATTAPLLVTEANEAIATEAGVRLTTESA